MSDNLILGIDGGGSKMLVALANRDGVILRVSRGGGVNPMDNPMWEKELRQQVQPFLPVPGLSAVAAALPAYGEVTRLTRAQESVVGDLFGNIRRRILNDVDAAHLGAFAGGPGTLILSGTGSMAWARNSQGKFARVGGWGEVIGDEGSSYSIGRSALSLVSQSFDGRAKPTALADALFDHLRLDPASPIEGLAGWVNELASPRAGVAALSALVDRVAKTGDHGALSLIEQAGRELAKHHQAITARFETVPDWTYAGGTFSSRLLQEAVERHIGTPPVAAILPPIGGALLAAAQLLGWPIDDGWLGQIAASASFLAASTNETSLNHNEGWEHA